jgi:DNA/RNA-binding domain of Phe-tRNA-synthetase-like protein
MSTLQYSIRMPGATIDPAVRALRPDFAVLVVTVRGLANGPGDETSEAWLRRAEAYARETGAPPAHVTAWQDAYRAFGAKPQRTPSSLEALWKRAMGSGLPRVNWLVDVYNAVSVLHGLPVGGEDLSAYQGAPRLLRATGHEPFDTIESGRAVDEPPAPGEVVWTDDLGVTCRRWNWRQCVRTRLREESREALFLLERLAPLPLAALDEAGDALLGAVGERWPGATVSRARLGPDRA